MVVVDTEKGVGVGSECVVERGRGEGKYGRNATRSPPQKKVGKARSRASRSARAVAAHKSTRIQGYKDHQI